jgi:cytochrome c oxidase subunit 1
VDEPSFTTQALAMISVCLFGGISGLVNASYNINLVVHNTAWVPGHFHLTVGTAVTLSFIGHPVLAAAAPDRQRCGAAK